MGSLENPGKERGVTRGNAPGFGSLVALGGAAKVFSGD